LLGGLAAFGLIRFRYRFSLLKRIFGKSEIPNHTIMLGMLATRILPPVIVTLPIYILALGADVLDTHASLIMVYVASNLPIAVLLLFRNFKLISTDIIDAAELDGASYFRIFFDIILPIGIRGVAATTVFLFALSWNEYPFAAMLTTDHALTMPPFLSGQMATREQMATAGPQWGYFSTLIVLMVAPLMLFAGALQRTFFGGQRVSRE
jgi:multiple sugar transport system permease protein